MNELPTLKSSTSPLASLYGENNLLLPLGPRVAFHEIASRLSNKPLRNYDLNGLDASDREELLVLYKQNFAATTTSIDIFAALQKLHREHYWQRHPQNPKTLRTRAQIAQFSRMVESDINSIPWLDNSASGMIIKGITGTGKTSAINRYTGLLGAQVHEHVDGAIPGFEYVKQIVWLAVDMSSDGSRDGFLTSILLKVDSLIGTNYARQYSGRYSVDKLAIMVAIILSTHLCGMLIIEEIQEENFNNSKWRNPLTTFFLRVLNFGIPTVLIGNPLGFTDLQKSSQNVRRLSDGGIFEMMPSLNSTDLDFKNLVRQTLSFSVMEQKNVHGEAYFREMAYIYSGGITDFVVRLNIESQRIALRFGDKEVLPMHIDAAFNSPNIKPNHPLICGLARRDRSELCKCDDVPVEQFVKLWQDDDAKNCIVDERKPAEATKQQRDIPSDGAKKKVESSDSEKNQASRSSKKQTNVEAKDEPKSEHPLARQFKSQQTRETNRKKKAAEQKALLSSDDIRGEGASASLVSNLKDLLQKMNKPLPD